VTKQVVYAWSIAALVFTGCAGILGEITPVLLPEPCIATYQKATPQSDIGKDGCGNLWVRQDGECYILDDSLNVMVKMPRCPDEGEVLGDQ